MNNIKSNIAAAASFTVASALVVASIAFAKIKIDEAAVRQRVSEQIAMQNLREQREESAAKRDAELRRECETQTAKLRAQSLAEEKEAARRAEAEAKKRAEEEKRRRYGEIAEQIAKAKRERLADQAYALSNSIVRVKNQLADCRDDERELGKIFEIAEKNVATSTVPSVVAARRSKIGRDLLISKAVVNDGRFQQICFKYGYSRNSVVWLLDEYNSTISQLNDNFEKTYAELKRRELELKSRFASVELDAAEKALIEQRYDVPIRNLSERVDSERRKGHRANNVLIDDFTRECAKLAKERDAEIELMKSNKMKLDASVVEMKKYAADNDYFIVKSNVNSAKLLAFKQFKSKLVDLCNEPSKRAAALRLSVEDKVVEYDSCVRKLEASAELIDNLKLCAADIPELHSRVVKYVNDNIDCAFKQFE